MPEEMDSKPYQTINLNELLTYAVYLLNEDGVEATFENIVAKCFELFPERFGLIGYPQWPDSARVNKVWLRCRSDFKYIRGSVKDGFKITSKGFGVVKKLQRKIRVPTHQRQITKTLARKERTREETFINQLEKSDSFKEYQQKGEEFSLSEYELCDLLFCTLQSPFNIRLKNLDLLKGYAEVLNRKEVLKFLNLCESKYR
ncbi:hypothetical protein GTO36_06645, partial [bacterium]|nr:hypothetical protein [bacterium]